MLEDQPEDFVDPYLSGFADDDEFDDDRDPYLGEFDSEDEQWDEDYAG